ncbi:MAG: hypothetical protein R2856_11405 [Caldilineaceae bacterium]
MVKSADVGELRHLSSFQAMLDLPVQIANDVDCMAFAEFQHTSEPLEKNLAYVGYDEAVKVSLFLRGELYKGSLGNAGLIGSHLINAGDQLDSANVHRSLTVVGSTRSSRNGSLLLSKKTNGQPTRRFWPLPIRASASARSSTPRTTPTRSASPSCRISRRRCLRRG